MVKSSPNDKSQYLYENLPVKTKISLFVKEINTYGYIVAWAIYTLHTDSLHPDIHSFTAQQHAYQSFLSYFLVGFC